MENKKTKQEDKPVQHSNIFSALSAFQNELRTMKKTVHVEFKTKTGGIINFSYTPLGEIMNIIYPILGKNGLSVRHEISHVDGKDGVEAILSHPQLREEIRSGIVYTRGSDMKEIGGAITYARRYTLTMLLGVASEDDLDAKLFEDRAEAAMGYAYSKAKQGIKNAQTQENLDKATHILRSDMEKLQKGSTGALGLNKKQYDELIGLAVSRSMELGSELNPEQ